MNLWLFHNFSPLHTPKKARVFAATNYFVQLGFNLSNGVTDTLESSSMPIYLIQMKSNYTQKDSINSNWYIIKRKARGTKLLISQGHLM
jgi:hypothetical protein